MAKAKSSSIEFKSETRWHSLYFVLGIEVTADSPLALALLSEVQKIHGVLKCVPLCRRKRNQVSVRTYFIKLHPEVEPVSFLKSQIAKYGAVAEAGMLDRKTKGLIRCV